MLPPKHLYSAVIENHSPHHCGVNVYFETIGNQQHVESQSIPPNSSHTFGPKQHQPQGDATYAYHITKIEVNSAHNAPPLVMEGPFVQTVTAKKTFHINDGAKQVALNPM